MTWSSPPRPRSSKQRQDADVIIGLGAPITLTLLKSVTDAQQLGKGGQLRPER